MTNDRQTIADLTKLIDEMRADRAAMYNGYERQVKTMRTALRAFLRWSGALKPSESLDLPDFTEAEATELAKTALAAKFEPCVVDGDSTETIRALRAEDKAQLSRGVAMQAERDSLLQACAELIPFALSEKLTSHKSFDRTEPFTRQSVVKFAREAIAAASASPRVA